MSQNDYIILRDEDGKAYIAHAGLLDNARNVISTAAQQVANKAKGVGRGVRQNHKYILKVNENGKTRYFYKQEEVKAYYEAKRKGIKNPAEYAQKATDAASNAVDAVKNATSKVGNAARSAFREATGQAARDRMDAAAEKYPELENNRRKKKQEYSAATYQADRASNKLADAYANARVAEGRADRSNIFNRKQRNNEADNARKVEAEARREFDEAVERERDAMIRSINANQKYANAKIDYDKNKAAYDKSLAGAVDRTAARARETAANAKDTASSAFNRAKDAANNTVSNAKNAYERMKGEFRDRAEQAGNAVKSTAKNAVDKAKDIAGYDEKERFDKAAENKQNTKDAARKGEQYVTDVLNESNPLHRTQTEAQRLNAAIGIRNERWNAEDKARAEYLRARDAYNKTPLAMINRAKEAISSATDSVRDATKDTAEAVARVPKAVKNAVKNAVEDVTFNAQYYSKQLKEGITGEKATKMASDIREEARIWKNRADGTKDKDLRNFYEQQYQKAEDFAKRFDAQAAKSLNGRANSAVNSVKGMIDNARSSTAKAVNEAWDKIPKNSDGTVNPFDKNFQSTYNDWKTKKDKYDNSLTGKAKATAEKATDSVKDMIDQAKKAVSSKPPTPTLSSPNNPIQTENIIRENIIEEQRTPEQRINEQKIEEQKIEEQHLPERTWDSSEKKPKVRTWDDVGQEINERGHTKKPDPINASGARPYETLKQDAREAGIDFTAYDKAVSNAEKLAKRLMNEYREANESPGPKSLYSKMWYDDPEYKQAVEKRKIEEEKLVKKLYY